MNKPFKVIGIVVLCLFALVLAKDQVIKLVVTTAGSAVTGAQLEIKRFSLGLIKQQVRIGGLVMHQPKQSPERGAMLELSTANVDYDLGEMIKGRVHLKSAEFDLKQMVLVKDKDGKLNVDSLKVSKKEEAGKPKAKQPPLRIDVLKLNIGRVVSEDFSRGKEPFIEVYNLNIKKTLHNITSPQQLALYILTEPMKAAGIKGATIYGIAALAGSAILPVAVATTFLGKDSSVVEFKAGFDKAYEASLDAMKRSGKVKKAEKTSGVISADVEGADVSLEVKALAAGTARVTVSARKLMMPKPEIAAGILYKVEKELE
jgi:hypothetical protein